MSDARSGSTRTLLAVGLLLCIGGLATIGSGLYFVPENVVDWIFTGYFVYGAGALAVAMHLRIFSTPGCRGFFSIWFFASMLAGLIGVVPFAPFLLTAPLHVSVAILGYRSEPKGILRGLLPVLSGVAAIALPPLMLEYFTGS